MEYWGSRDNRGGLQDSRSVSPMKRQRPDLNIITDLSQGQPDPRAGAPAFVSLKDLRKLVDNNVAAKDSQPKERGRNLQRFKSKNGSSQKSKVQKSTSGGDMNNFAALRKPKFANGPPGSSSLAQYVKSQEVSTADISPSARTIVIGIDDEVIQNHIQRQQDDARQMSEEPSQKTPATPTIIITPAEEEPITYGLSVPVQSKRPASSIYSQATTYSTHLPSSNNVPPVPPLPMSRTGISSGKVDPARTSIDSWERDSIADVKDQESVFSDDSDRVILKRKDTMTSSRRPSKGWWNLVSPIFSRSNTVIKKSPATDENVPPLPKPITTSVRPKRDWKDELSPETPRRAGIETSSVSTWSRWSDWERDRGMADSTDVPPMPTDLSREQQFFGTGPQETEPVVEGLAAEYFQACAHDLISPAPYFECQNHSCAERLPQLISSKKDMSLPVSDDIVHATKFIDKDKALDLNGTGRSVKPSVEESSKSVDDVKGPRYRSGSESTVIEDDSEDEDEAAETQPSKPAPTPSPQKISGKVKPRAAAAPSPSPAQTAQRDQLPTPAEPSLAAANPAPENRITRFPAPAEVPLDQPSSPAPLSPEAQRILTPPNGVSLNEISFSRPTPAFITNNYYTHLPPRPNATPLPVPKSDTEIYFPPPPLVESQRPVERDDKVKEKTDESSGTRRCVPVKLRKGCFGRGKDKPEDKKKKRWIILIALLLLSIVVACIILATTLTRRGDHTPVQSQWLNLTGFPPMPTGIMTVAQPDVSEANSGCVHPDTMWSCALPKEEANKLSTADADQPNFRFEIRFRNGTVENGTTTTSSTTSRKRGLLDSASSRAKLHHKMLQIRDAFTDALYTPSPSPPSLAEQAFLGNTTDNTTYPFEGEPTPFYMSFISPDTSFSGSDSTSQLSKRQSNDSSLPNLNSSIPSPSTTTSGIVAPATLLPFPSSQPVRLYNRGLPTEHYGFYTYFDRSIFLTSVNSTDNDLPSDVPGGANESSANFVCTWTQTRFLVQIWTSQASGFALLDPLTNSSSSSTTSSSPSATTTTSSTSSYNTSSALDFSRPGSFPYPITITLDRHGGSQQNKLLFCYSLDENRKPTSGTGQLMQEFRSANGGIVNPAEGLFNLDGSSSSDQNTQTFGGIDGGEGGCKCRWNNFGSR